MSGPDFGRFFFGAVTLNGKPAKVAGLSLVVLITISTLLSLWVKAHR